MPTPMQTHQQTIHDLKSTKGPVPLTSPTQKPVVLCTQLPAGEHHTKKADDARQPKRLKRQHTHPSATRHPHLPTPNTTHCTMTCCAPLAHPLLPTAMAFVPHVGFVPVLFQFRVRTQLTAQPTPERQWGIGLLYMDTHTALYWDVATSAATPGFWDWAFATCLLCKSSAGSGCARTRSYALLMK
jgi:hypothetical protein